jgi:Tol biopolymer transport system component
LSERHDDAWLIALGSDVSDGRTVDWDEVDRRTTDDEARNIVENLKRLEAVIHGHRSADDGDGRAAPPGESATGHWHHLVLFERVGRGAFGDVYRAWDTKLDREVALKLRTRPPSTGRSPDSEARNLARIHHPNIVTVYGVEEIDGQVGIWMEYIQGQTLADMVNERGPMSAREVVGIGIDLCGALSALQAASLLHRDIKAQNVMRQVGGRIVLMDFSGAWTSEAGETATDFSGTPAYMAPELFDGRPTSIASDIYSLGVLLFYLLSGRRPVEAGSLAELKEAHARGARTRLRDLRPELPEGVVQIVERAAAHDPHERFHSAGELEHALTGTLGAHAVATVPGLAASGGTPPTARRPIWVTWLPFAATAALLVLLAPGWGLGPTWLGSAAPDKLMVRYDVPQPENTGSWPRLSPDGRLIVFGSAVEGVERLWVRPLGSTVGLPVAGTIARESPFWSPDGRFLAVFEKEKLKKISVSGEVQPVTLADVPSPKGGDWSQDDVLLFAGDDGIYRVGPDGKGLSRVTTVDPTKGEYAHHWPEFLPDGQRFLFLVRSRQPDHGGVYIGRLDSGKAKRLMPDYSRAVYANGYVLAVRDGALLAQRFDDRAEELRGQPKVLAGRVKYHPGGDAAFDASESGVLIYRQAEGLPATRLMLLDRNGGEIRSVGPIGTYRHPRFSPDGKRLVFESIDPQTANPDIELFDLERNFSSRLTSNAAPDVAPAWSPRGDEIAFSSKRGPRYEVYTKAIDQVAPERLRSGGPDADKYVEHWTPNNELVETATRNGLWLAPVAEGRPMRLLRPTTSILRWLAEMSPDGKWLAYTTYELGHPEVFVSSSASDYTTHIPVSSNGGAEPHWGTSSELFYLTLDGDMALVEVEPGAEWRPRKERRLFRARVPEADGTSDYHVTSDGRQFVINTILGYPQVPAIQVMVNWTGPMSR